MKLVKWPAVLLMIPWQLGAQGAPSSDLESVEQKKIPEIPSGMIGMEAFRDVLASGRYLVGPGDGFLVYVTGMDKPFFGEVLAEGGLFVPQVGTVKVGGLRLGAAHRAIESAFRRTVKVGEIAVELNKPREFPVPVVGLVEEPGIAVATGVERISTVVQKRGGLDEGGFSRGSSRNIRLFRTGTLEPQVRARVKMQAEGGNFLELEGLEAIRVDLELYRTTGDSSYNPFVEDGDIIFVPAQQGRVRAEGAVQRSGFYEFVEGDRLSDLLILALGPAPNYNKEKVLLFRYALDGIERYALQVDVEGLLNRDPEADLPLQSGDWLVFREVSGFHPPSTVTIEGEVTHPGVYVIQKGRTTLRNIIAQAGGFTDEASLSEAVVVRYPQVGEKARDPEAERISAIPVPDRTDLENQYFIMKSRERVGQMVVDFVALFGGGDGLQDILLMPGDFIVVPTLQQTIMVSGQAASPGAVLYDPEYTVWDYLERAGGFGWRASKDVLVIKGLSGEIKRARDVERIEPGDRIWIKEEPVRNYWAIFSQTMEVIGQVTTVVLLYVTLTR